jgi:hypothetical protein
MADEISYSEGKRLTEEGIAKFPATFALAPHPGETFRVNARASYHNGRSVQIVIERKMPDGTWADFCRESLSTALSYVVPFEAETKGQASPAAIRAWAADGRTDGAVNSDNDADGYDGKRDPEDYANECAHAHKASIMATTEPGSRLADALEECNGDAGAAEELVTVYVNAYANGLKHRISAKQRCEDCGQRMPACDCNR